MNILIAQIATGAIGMLFLWLTRTEDEDWSKGSPRRTLIPLVISIVILITWIPKMIN